MHLLLKVNTDDPRLLATHVDWASLHGAVWFGRDDNGKPVAAGRLRALEAQLRAGVDTLVYLHPTGAHAGESDGLRATLLEAQVKRPSGTDPAFPAPWYKGSSPKNLWLKLSDFVPCSPDWAETHLRYLSDGRPLGAGLRNQTSPMYVKYEP